jgi:hypothetical protein
MKVLDLDYRVLSNCVEPKTVGVTNGAGQTWFDDDFFIKNPNYYKTFYNHEALGKEFWKKWAKWQEYGENLSEIKMYKKSKHTDFMTSHLFRGFFVNTKLKEILESCNLPNHHFFEVTFRQSDKQIDGYWWFCFDTETGENILDFSKCEYDFSFHQHRIDKNFSAKINSYHDYMKVFYDTGIALKTTELVFNGNFNIELDIWGTQFLTNETYISKKLLSKLEAAKITGYSVGYPIYHMLMP